MIPVDLRYTKEHEWLKAEGGRGRIGITRYASEALGDIVYVELPAEGTVVSAGDSFGVLESVKAASDCYSPVSGKVVEVNRELAENPKIINEDPYGRGWLIVVEMSNPAEIEELLTAEEYLELLNKEGE